MKSIKLILVGLVVFIFFGCSTLYVVYDYDVEADFSKYKTFRWATDVEDKTETGFDNSLMDKRLKHAISLELENKGYVKAEKDVDLILAYEQSSHMEEDVYVTSYHQGWRHHGLGFGVSRVSRDRYMEGMIIMKIYDNETDELIWQGWASGIEVVVEYIEEIINETAQELIDKFPPPQKKK
jgi:hypothetical protein